MTNSRVLGATAVGMVIAVAVALVVTLTGPTQKRATAIFRQAVLLFPGDDVRVLGVPVGTITSITTGPDGVRVDLAYDADAPVPADAMAEISATSLVSARFVQLTPARLAGPRLPDGATIPMSRTMVPLEFDQIKQQLSGLAAALGPNGANADGAVSRALHTTAGNLAGNGQSLNRTVDQLAQAVGTLSDGRVDLFGTVRNLQTLVTAVRGADSQVGQFTNQLAEVSGVLADSSADLGRALDAVDATTNRIGDFVRDNRDQLSDTVKGLAHVAKTLADNRQGLADVLQVAPNAVANFQNIYDPFSSSLQGVLAVTQFQDVPQVVCSAILSTGQGVDKCTKATDPILGLLKLDYPPLAFDAIQRNGSKNVVSGQDGQCKPPPRDPQRSVPYDPKRFPPKPHQGAGTQPYFAGPNRCHRSGGGDVSSESSLSSLFVPTGGGR